MLISHRHQFIYTKTGKTAGTAVEVYFEPFCTDKADNRDHAGAAYVSDAGIVAFRGKPCSDFRGKRYSKECVWWHHMPAAEIRKLVGDETWNKYFKFCVIRNPYDKAISLFYYLRKHGRIETNPELSDREQFQAWVLRGRVSVDRDRYFIDEKFCLDDVIRYERIVTDMERICDRIGVPWIPSAFVKLKTGIRPAFAKIDNMYSPESAAIIHRLYSYEFSKFGYPVEIEHYARNEAIQPASP